MLGPVPWCGAHSNFGLRAKQADLLLIDDRKAQKEALALGFKVLKTSGLLQRAESLGFFTSYPETKILLEKQGFYWPK